MTAQPPIPTTSTPRVVIVDADRRVAASVAEALGLDPRVEVVGTARSVAAALELAERETPDVVLVDPRLPELPDGVALLTALCRRSPRVRLVLTGWRDPTEHPEVAACARRFVPKGADPEAFVAEVIGACCDDEVVG